MHGISSTTTNLGMLEDAKIIVGIDFGTTFSGFAYASMADPEKVYSFYDWPWQAAAGSKPYCKTQTSLWYLPGKLTGTYELQSWGWEAQVKYIKALQEMKSNARVMTANSTLGKRSFPLGVDPLLTSGHFLTKFKLVLDDSNSDQLSELEELPDGLLPEKVISDYLKQLSIFILKELQNRFGNFIMKKDIKWCLTFPTIWSDAAKQTMIDCAEMAGLVRGRLCPVGEDASLHKIDVVLEPEAASICCLQRKDIHLRKGGKFLVVDAGGGTVDLVVHEKLDDSGMRVKEVSMSTGCLCGGTFVDKAFMKFMARKIDCFENFSEAHPSTILTIKRHWENFKCSFDGEGDSSSFGLELPSKLADAWEAHQRRNGSWSAESQYDEIMITRDDMMSFFDGEVDKIITFIEAQLNVVPDIELILVVGGFSNSAYLMKRIRHRFGESVKQIISPPDPGCAVFQGAVAFGTLGPDIMMCRKSRKTYGVDMAREFQRGDPQSSMIFNDEGRPLCTTSFLVFTRIGDDVPVDHFVTHPAVPVSKKSKSILINMYSTRDPQPKFVTDVGVVKVGSLIFHLPPEAMTMDEEAELEVTMYFGKTHIQLSATPTNFDGGPKPKVSIVFKRDLR